MSWSAGMLVLLIAFALWNASRDDALDDADLREGLVKPRFDGQLLHVHNAEAYNWTVKGSVAGVGAEVEVLRSVSGRPEHVRVRWTTFSRPPQLSPVAFRDVSHPQWPDAAPRDLRELLGERAVEHEGDLSCEGGALIFERRIEAGHTAETVWQWLRWGALTAKLLDVGLSRDQDRLAALATERTVTQMERRAAAWRLVMVAPDRAGELLGSRDPAVLLAAAEVIEPVDQKLLLSLLRDGAVPPKLRLRALDRLVDAGAVAHGAEQREPILRNLQRVVRRGSGRLLVRALNLLVGLEETPPLDVLRERFHAVDADARAALLQAAAGYDQEALAWVMELLVQNDDHVDQLALLDVVFRQGDRSVIGQLMALAPYRPQPWRRKVMAYREQLKATGGGLALSAEAAGDAGGLSLGNQGGEVSVAAPSEVSA